jgi:hypothetical protein
LISYFRSLVDVRGFPLHSTVLWNALAWGFDTASGCYPQAPIDDLVVVTHSSSGTAVPLGTFVRVPFGGQAVGGRDEFWGEVVYKEGRSVDIESSWAPPGLSGAPASVEADEAGMTTSTIREALIIDFEALIAPNPHDLLRQSERGVAIDSRNHVVLDSVYRADATESGHTGLNEADLDDATFFARWMVANYAESLRRGSFGAALGAGALAEDAVLLEVLVSTLSTIETLAGEVPGCRSWRGFLFDAAAYEDRCRDTENALGGSDMARMVWSLASIPHGENVCYSGLGPRLTQDFGDDAEFHGPGWATITCHFSTFILEWLGLNATAGVLTTASGPVHLRLDDSWQSGGIWRAQRVVEGRDPICMLPPELALGLGYAEASGVVLRWPELAELEEALEAEPETLEISATELGARVVLSATDIDSERLRLPFAFATEVAVTAESAQVIIRLCVEDHDLESSERTHPIALVDGTSLFGVCWPWPFVVGLRAEVVWTRGTGVIDVTARLRPEPLVIDGVEFRWDCDEVVYARSAGLTPPLVTTRAINLRDLILGVFRARTRPDDDGFHRASLAQLSFAIYGAGASDAARRALETVVETLCAEGILIRESAIDLTSPARFAWLPAQRQGTRVADRDTLTHFQGANTRYVRAHEVGLHLRRLWVSEVATRDREVQYRSEWEAAGRPWWLPSALPPGYTFVRKHVRGT